MLHIKNRLILYILIFFIGCVSVENNIEDLKINKKIDIRKIAYEKFGNDYSLDFNSSKEFVICRKVSKSQIVGNSPIEYFIYSVNKNQIIEENIIPQGNISWVSQFEVKVEVYPGIVQKTAQANNGYILNVKTNLKTNLNGGVL